MDFSPDQEIALHRINDWRATRVQSLTMGGFAGCGKTMLLAYLGGEWQGIRICALCGKAANVLRGRGVPAQTIHSLIYEPSKANGRVRFKRRRQLEGVSVIGVDEASMVDHVLHQDLLAFGLPILWVGDHGQLEPIGTNPQLMRTPNIRLERIHRQAEGNPILALAAAFREGRSVPSRGQMGKGAVKLVSKCDFWKYVAAGVQIICGFNRTRHEVNRSVRAQRGYKGLLCPGECILCLRNSQEHELFNGQLATVEACRPDGQWLELDIVTEERQRMTVPALARQFGADPLKWEDPSVCLFDYGYALTAHKAQGSEYQSVVILEEIASLWDPRRWRYTTATRAKATLVYCS